MVLQGVVMINETKLLIGLNRFQASVRSSVADGFSFERLKEKLSKVEDLHKREAEISQEVQKLIDKHKAEIKSLPSSSPIVPFSIGEIVRIVRGSYPSNQMATIASVTAGSHPSYSLEGRSALYYHCELEKE